MRMAEHPIADVVLQSHQERRERYEHIMQRNSDDRRDGIAAQCVGQAERQEGLDSEERGEADEHADGHSARDGMGRILE